MIAAQFQKSSICFADSAWLLCVVVQELCGNTGNNGVNIQLNTSWVDF